MYYHFVAIDVPLHVSVPALYLLARKVRKVPQLLDRITELDDSFSSFSLQAATFDSSENLRKISKKPLSLTLCKAYAIKGWKRLV